MRIVVRFATDTEESTSTELFNSQRDVRSDDSAMVYGAKVGVVLTQIVNAFREDIITEAWIELDNGKKFSLVLAE